MHMICERHDLDATQLEFAPPGTHVVFRVRPNLYIKLFAPLWQRDFVPERLVLHRLSDERPDLPIPRLVAEGEIESWSYIIITAVEGVPLYEVWDSMSMSDRERIAVGCGELIASLHSTRTEGLEEIAVDWPGFVEGQIQDCIDELARSGVGEHWTQAVVEFFQDIPPLFEPGFKPVLLSADVTDEHILVSQLGGRWELTGFVDFGDAMLGHPHYDFVAPGCSITRSSSDLQRAMLLAYGYPEDQLDETMARQLMAYTLIHGFINIPELLELFGPQQPESFEDLRNQLWSFSD